MKIILANKFYFLKGGADRYFFDLEAELKRRGNEVFTFAMHHPGNLESKYSKYFVSNVHTESVKFGWQGLRTLGRMVYSFEAKKKMRQLIEDFKPDLCHVHNIYYQISPSILAALDQAQIPIVMTIHDYHMISPQYMMWSHGKIEDWADRNIVSSALSRFHKNSIAASLAASGVFKLHRLFRFYHLVDKYIAPSKFVRDLLVHKGFDSGKIEVLPYGIDIENRPARPDQDEGYVLFVGRLVSEKGVWVILEAAKEMPDVQFKIVGRGPDEDRLHQFADHLSNVEFLGFREDSDLIKLYQNARAVLAPSLWYEVFGLVVLEAMAAGKPVIASDIGALPEIVEDGVTGLIVRPGSVIELKEAITRLVENPHMAQEFGREARKRVETVYTPQRHYDRLVEIYQEIAKS